MCKILACLHVLSQYRKNPIDMRALQCTHAHLCKVEFPFPFWVARFRFYFTNSFVYGFVIRNIVLYGTYTGRMRHIFLYFIHLTNILNSQLYKQNSCQMLWVIDLIDIPAYSLLLSETQQSLIMIVRKMISFF